MGITLHPGQVTTECWQEIREAFRRKGGGEVRLLGGVYTIESTLDMPKNTTLRGCGKGVSTIVTDQDSAIIEGDPGATPPDNVRVDDLTIEGVSLERQGAGTQIKPLIDFTDVSHSRIENVSLKNAGGTLDTSGIKLRSNAYFNQLFHIRIEGFRIGVDIVDHANANSILGGAITNCIVGVRIHRSKETQVLGLGIAVEDSFDGADQIDSWMLPGEWLPGQAEGVINDILPIGVLMQTNATDSTIGHDASYNQITGVQVRGCEVAFVEWGSNTDNTYIGCSAENVTAKFRSWGSTQVLDASPVGLKPSSTQVEFEQRTVVKTWGVDPGLTGWNRFYLVQEQEDGKLSPCTRTAIPIGFLHSIPNRSGDPAFISLLTPGRAFTGIAGHTLAVGWVGCDDNGKLENKTSGFAVGRVDQIWELDEKVKVACMPTFIP